MLYRQVHDEEADRRKERAAEAQAGGVDSLVVMPPAIEVQQKWLVTTVAKAEYLPVMDQSLTGGAGGGDYFFQVRLMLLIFCAFLSTCQEGPIRVRFLRLRFGSEVFFPPPLFCVLVVLVSFHSGCSCVFSFQPGRSAPPPPPPCGRGRSCSVAVFLRAFHGDVQPCCSRLNYFLGGWVHQVVCSSASSALFRVVHLRSACSAPPRCSVLPFFRSFVCRAARLCWNDNERLSREQVEVAGGKPIRTKAVTIAGDRHKLNPEWRYELWQPVTTPCMSGNVKVCTRDFGRWISSPAGGARCEKRTRKLW